MFRIKWIFIVSLFLCSTITYSQFFKRQKNKYDENGKRTGLWITYWDDKEKIPMSVISFKNGYEVGVSKEYHQNGNLRLKFRYHKNRMRVKYYDENRKLDKKGWSVIEYNEADTHYYWHGRWKFYNEKGKIDMVALYQNGREVSSE